MLGIFGKRLLGVFVVAAACAGVARALETTSLSLSATEIDFGNLANAASRVSTITLTNHLESPVGIDRIQTNSEEFRLDNAHSTCPFNDGSLGPGQSCNLSVEFDPAGPGSRAGLLTILSYPGPSPQIVRLLGRNGAAEPGSAVTVDMSRIPDSREPAAGDTFTAFVARPMRDVPGGVATAVPPGARIVPPALRSPDAVAPPPQLPVGNQ